MSDTTFLGIELGSTRIKAVAISSDHQPVGSGGYTWASRLENGVWTYDLDEAWVGLNTALDELATTAGTIDHVGAAGVSAMMHGYLAFDKDWNLLTPFRTWQNTITGPAADELTDALGFNIPQRWTAAHLYQAILNGEDHLPRVAHITTLAGYIHHQLTGVNAVGVGEASGIFPIDSTTLDYDQSMLDIYDNLLHSHGFTKTAREVFPAVLNAGDDAGSLTEAGAQLLGGRLAVGTPFAPCEGDAGTGMTATNAVAERTGNVSAGTSIFSMVVLERALSAVYQEIDMVTTPSGKPVAMVHCNNGTADMNSWVSLFQEVARLYGADPSDGELYGKLYQASLDGDANAGGIITFNYRAGEGVTHLDAGRPMVVRTPDAPFTLANFLRSQLYATMATLTLGMRILTEENVRIDSLTGHGGLFRQPIVGQRYMAAATGAPVTVMETAGEGGPYGMALLAAYRVQHTDGETLEQYLDQRVFATAEKSTIDPLPEDVVGFADYLRQYEAALPAERAAVEHING